MTTNMFFFFLHVCSVHDNTLRSGRTAVCPPTAVMSVPSATLAFVPAPSPTVVDQTTLMKKYLQFVAALTDANTRKFIHLAVFCLT